VARNRAGIVDAGREAGVLSELDRETRAELIRLGQERAAAARHLGPDSARLQALDRRIGSLREQLATLGVERTAPNRPGGSLAEVMARFSEIEVEQQLAERRFLAAARELEEVRKVSQARMMYLDIFVPPDRPEEATRPRRALAAAAWSAGALVAWAALCGIAGLARRHMA
jgi:capsule polysaccharide export protein KpsE/RkpR